MKRFCKELFKEKIDNLLPISAVFFLLLSVSKFQGNILPLPSPLQIADVLNERPLAKSAFDQGCPSHLHFLFLSTMALHNFGYGETILDVQN